MAQSERKKEYQRKYIKEYWAKNKEKRRQNKKAYKLRHPEKQREWSKKYRDKIKLLAFSKLGNGTIRCVHCGESRMACLTVDHIKGGGRQHLREMGLQAGHNLYLWILRNGDLADFQLLCMNCQWVKRVMNAEVCSHRQKRGKYKQL